MRRWRIEDLRIALGLAVDISQDLIEQGKGEHLLTPGGMAVRDLNALLAAEAVDFDRSRTSIPELRGLVAILSYVAPDGEAWLHGGETP